jgi:aminoglycoside phosphotransferase (APT) family kinase protein
MAEAPKGIRPDAVERWLVEHVEGVKPPVRFELLAGGHSNLTYRVSDADGGDLVLRRPPTGHLLASAHDMAREHRIISAVGPAGLPAPETLGLCEDDSVNDAPFYVMSYVDGYVLHDATSVNAHVPVEERPDLADSLVDVMAALHSIDPDEVGLGDLAKKEDYIPRQLRRWKGQWEKSKTRELPAMEAVLARLESSIPEQRGASIVHGDYRLGNCMTGRDFRIAAVLDWELCTLGDPMADVGYLMNNWTAPDEIGVGREASPSAAGGFPERDHLLERYAKATGRDVSMVDYYRAFSYWRLAAIVEGVLARYVGGQMADDAVDPAMFREQVDNLARSAEEAVERMPA